MEKPFLLILCALVFTACGSTAPEQLHVSAHGQDKDGYIAGATIMWFTAEPTATSTVKYGTVPGSLTEIATGSAASYLPGGGWHHKVTIPSVRPSTQYHYRAGDAEGGWSEEWAFTSLPAKDKPFSMSVFGDMGWLGSAERPMEIDHFDLAKNWSAVGTRTQLERLKDAGDIDAIWILGDIAYADDAFAHHVLKFGYEDVYNGYMNWMQNVTAVMPLFVSPGNHESECHSVACLDHHARGIALSNFSAYNARFSMPSEASGGVLNMWYSFNIGPVHFVSMNTETDWPGAGEENKGDSGIFPAGHFAPNGTYMQWLEADLKAAFANKAQRPWIVAGGHRPIGALAKAGVQDLFKKYGVDLYVCGHHHGYARSKPAYRSSVEHHHALNHYKDAEATTYIVVGGAGCDEMENLQSPVPGAVPVAEAEAPLCPPGAEVEDVATSRMASGVLTVHNATTLHWRLLRSFDGSILDELYLSKSLD